MSNVLPFCYHANMDDFDNWPSLTDEEKEQELCEYLSDEFGFCVNSFFWGEYGDCVVMTEIDWDTTD